MPIGIYKRNKIVIKCKECSVSLKRERKTGLCLKCLRKLPKSDSWKLARSKALEGNDYAKGKTYKSPGEYLTSLNLRARRTEDFRIWREAVFERDEWTCQKCDKVGGKLHAHHIKNFATYPELRFAIDNGVVLCRECHKKFHSKYGYKYTSKEQLIEYIINT